MLIPPGFVIGTIGIAGGMIGAMCASHGVPTSDPSSSGQQHAVGTPGNGDGRVFGIPVRANSGPVMTSAVVSAAPGDYVSKTDLGERPILCNCAQSCDRHPRTSARPCLLSHERNGPCRPLRPCSGQSLKSQADAISSATWCLTLRDVLGFQETVGVALWHSGCERQEQPCQQHADERRTVESGEQGIGGVWWGVDARVGKQGSS